MIAPSLDLFLSNLIFKIKQYYERYSIVVSNSTTSRYIEYIDKRKLIFTYNFTSKERSFISRFTSLSFFAFVQYLK